MIRTSQILLWFGLCIAAGTALYHTSDRTHELDRQLRDINESIENERQTIHVLEGEWAYLINPARVEAEANRHLTLRSTLPSQVIAMSDLDDALPARNEKTASVAVTAAPIATVKASLAAPHKTPYATADHSHINNRMIIQHTASVQSQDEIGSLISGLGSRP